MTEGRCKVKICGTTSVEDAQMVAEAGADYCGIVVAAPFSERSISIPHAVEITHSTPVPTIALLFNRPTDWIQQAVAKIRPTSALVQMPCCLTLSISARERLDLVEPVKLAIGTSQGNLLASQKFQRSCPEEFALKMSGRQLKT